MIDLLKAYFKIQDRDNQREIREKVTGKLLTLDKSLEPTLPAFLALLDVPVEDQQWQALDPSQHRQRTLDACQTSPVSREPSAATTDRVFEDFTGSIQKRKRSSTAWWKVYRRHGCSC